MRIGVVHRMIQIAMVLSFGVSKARNTLMYTHRTDIYGIFRIVIAIYILFRGGKQCPI